jgi:hypothetical protein
MITNHWRFHRRRKGAIPLESPRDATGATAWEESLKQHRLANVKLRRAFQPKEKNTWQCKRILFVECR